MTDSIPPNRHVKAHARDRLATPPVRESPYAAPVHGAVSSHPPPGSQYEGAFEFEMKEGNPKMMC